MHVYMKRIPYTTNSRQVFIQHSRMNEKQLDKAIRYLNKKCDAYDIITVYNPFIKDDTIDIEVNNKMSMLKRVVLINIIDSYTNVKNLLFNVDMPNKKVEEDNLILSVYKTIKIEDKLFESI